MNQNNFNHYTDEKSLNIREDIHNGIYVEGISEYIVENIYECLNLLKRGEKQRKKRTTKKNELSSRSHTLFSIMIESEKISKGSLKVF